MRSTRALFGAFGGGLTLAIAASAALLAVSSVIAFRGWPQSDAAPQNPEVAQLKKVRAEESKSAGVVHTVALPKAAPAVRHHAGAKARHHAKARHATHTRTRGTHHTVSTAATTTAKHHAASSDQTSKSDTQATSGNANPAKPVSDAVSNTTKAAADAVAPTAPQVSGALQSLGAAGADTVDKAGATAGKVVSTLTGG